MRFSYIVIIFKPKINYIRPAVFTMDKHISLSTLTKSFIGFYIYLLSCILEVKDVHTVVWWRYGLVTYVGYVSIQFLEFVAENKVTIYISIRLHTNYV